MFALLDQLSRILTFGGIVLGIFVVLLLNSSGVRRSRANFVLSILLSALSFGVAHSIFAGAIVSHFSAGVPSPGDPTLFLIAPLLWFYVMELTGKHVKLSWKLGLHFSPFLLIILLWLFMQSFHSEGLLTAFLVNHSRPSTIFFWMVVVVQFSCYQFLIHKRRLAFKESIRQEVSNTENINIDWIRFFVAVFLIINLFFLFSLFATIHLTSQPWLSKSIASLFSLSIFALGYKGILQREVFHTHFNERVDVDSVAKGETAVKPDQKVVDWVLAQMEEKRPYLDPELTLSMLAKNLDMSRSQLSQLINDGIGDNFYDFVNKYRVEQVKKLMVDPQVKNFNMLGLALEAGFKSKSTFNLIFKRFTGVTPTEYRKNISGSRPA